MRDSISLSVKETQCLDSRDVSDNTGNLWNLISDKFLNTLHVHSTCQISGEISKLELDQYYYAVAFISFPTLLTYNWSQEILKLYLHMTNT